jgi:hypothetical protein
MIKKWDSDTCDWVLNTAFMPTAAEAEAQDKSDE